MTVWNKRAEIIVRWRTGFEKIRSGLMVANFFVAVIENLDERKFKRHKNYLDKLRRGVHMVQVSTGALTDAQVHRAARAAMMAMKSGVVETERTGTGESTSAFWQQGDASLSTAENLRKRFKLRWSPLILKALELFWNAAVAGSAAIRDSAAAGGIRGAGRKAVEIKNFNSQASQGIITKEGHRELYRRIYKVMLEGWDPDGDDAEASVEEDWLHDCRGDQILTKEGFFDSLFELADTWTHKIDEQEYYDFLMDLFTTLMGGRLDAGNWASLDSLSFDERFMDEDEGIPKPPLKVNGEAIRARDELAELTQLAELQQLDEWTQAPQSPKMRKKDEMKKRWKSAAKIQALVRGRTARKKAQERVKATATIQAHSRGCIEGKKTSKSKEEKVEMMERRKAEEAAAAAAAAAADEEKKKKKAEAAHRQHKAAPPSGLKFKPVTVKPKEGRDITTAILAKTLRERSELTAMEVQIYKLQNIRSTDFVTLAPVEGGPFIVVNVIGMTLSIPVKLKDSLAKVKKTVELRAGTSLAPMQFSSFDEVFRDESQSLDSLGICSGDILSLIHKGAPPMQAFIVRVCLPASLHALYGKTLQVSLPPEPRRDPKAEVTTAATGRDLKGAICDIIGAQPNHQTITFNSEIVRDTQALKSAGVRTHDAVILKVPQKSELRPGQESYWDGGAKIYMVLDTPRQETDDEGWHATSMNTVGYNDVKAAFNKDGRRAPDWRNTGGQAGSLTPCGFPSVSDSHEVPVPPQDLAPQERPPHCNFVDKHSPTGRNIRANETGKRGRSSGEGPVNDHHRKGVDNGSGDEGVRCGDDTDRDGLLAVTPLDVNGKPVALPLPPQPDLRPLPQLERPSKRPSAHLPNAPAWDTPRGLHHHMSFRASTPALYGLQVGPPSRRPQTHHGFADARVHAPIDPDTLRPRTTSTIVPLCLGPRFHGYQPFLEVMSMPSPRVQPPALPPFTARLYGRVHTPLPTGTNLQDHHFGANSASSQLSLWRIHEASGTPFLSTSRLGIRPRMVSPRQLVTKG